MSKLLIIANDACAGHNIVGTFSPKIETPGTSKGMPFESKVFFISTTYLKIIPFPLFWFFNSFFPSISLRRKCVCTWLRLVRKIFKKTNISYHLIRTLTCAYQRVGNVSFSEYFAYALNEWSLARFKEAFITFFFWPITKRKKRLYLDISFNCFFLLL